MAEPPQVPLPIRQKLYRPLAPQHTRILRIHPANDDTTDLVCDLLVADIIVSPGIRLVAEARTIEYQALSYSWGYPNLDRAITCNGILLPVSGTMHEALRHIRDTDDERYLWTDCCCINQSDLLEKRQQVGMMFTIYEKANQVIAWLGLPTPEDDLFFAIVQDLGPDITMWSEDQAFFPAAPEASGERPYHPNSPIQNPDSETAIPQSFDGFAEPIVGPCPHSHARKAHSDLYESARAMIHSKPIFQRTWIRQEFMAARELTILCGTHCCSFLEFSNTLSHLLNRHEPIDSRIHVDISFTDPDMLRFRYLLLDNNAKSWGDKESPKIIWLRTMLRSSLYRSTLPQDKIYAALGIVRALTIQSKYKSAGAQEKDITQGFPAIDYTKSPSEVFQDFVKHTINVSHNFMCLGIFEDRSKRGQDLPSWTVDLRRECPRYLIKWSSSGQTEGEKTTIQHLGRTGELIVQGRTIGTTAAMKMDDPNNPWRDGYPRSFHGRRAPYLYSCFEAQAISSRAMDKAPDSGIEDMLNRLQAECQYKWMNMESKGRAVEMLIDSAGNTALLEENADSGRIAGPYVLTSHLAKEGDEVVRLYGSVDLCVLRRAEKEKQKAYGWEFLGPAFLVAACYKKENVEKNRQDQELWESPPLLNGPGWIRHEKELTAETFVLV